MGVDLAWYPSKLNPNCHCQFKSVFVDGYVMLNPHFAAFNTLTSHLGLLCIYLYTYIAASGKKKTEKVKSYLYIYIEIGIIHFFYLAGG